MRKFLSALTVLTCANLLAAEKIIDFDFEQGGLPSELKGNASFVAGEKDSEKALKFAKSAYMSVPASAVLKNTAAEKGIVFECKFFRDDIKTHGYIARQNNAFSVSVISWDPKRINIGIWTDKGYKSFDTEPILKSGVWYDVKVSIYPDECSLTVNGKTVFCRELPAPMRESNNPVILGAAFKEDGDRGLFGSFPVVYDYFRISEAEGFVKSVPVSGAAAVLPGADKQTVFKFDFEGGVSRYQRGDAVAVAGKPGYGKALDLKNNGRLEIPVSEIWNKAVNDGKFTFECWLYRDEEDAKGTIVRQDRCFTALVVPWDPRRINVGLWTKKGYVSFDSEQCLNSGVWQHVAIVVADGHCELLVNGRREFKRALKAPLLTSKYPIVVGGGYNSDVNRRKFIGHLDAKIDDVILFAGVRDKKYFDKIMAGTSENFEAIHSKIGLPPVCNPGKTIRDEFKKPVFKMAADGKTATVENNFYKVAFDVKPAESFRIRTLFNKFTGTECFGKEGSPVFAVNIDGKHIKNSDFKIQKTLWNGSDLKVYTRHEASGVQMILTLKFDNSEDISVDSVMINGNKSRRLLPTVPMLENISIGPDFDENWCFWPHITGWAGKKSYELGLRYAHRCWIQLAAVYSPSLGGGITLTGQDTSGYAKGIIVRKTKKDGSIGINYNQVAGVVAPQEKIFDSKLTGSGMAFAALPDTYAPGEKFSMPPAKISVHGGDILVPLMKYAKWSKKAFPHTPIPELGREDFCMVAVHRKTGNTGFDNRGWEGDKRYAFADHIHPDGRDHILQLAMWATRLGEDVCIPEFGGEEGMKKAIAEAHAKGTEITLYTCSRSMSKDAIHAKPEWQFQRKPGVGVFDWGGFNPCTAVEQWQDIFVGNNVRLAKTLPVSGIYLDTTAEIIICRNSAHSHPRNPVDSIMQLLKKANTRIKAVRPDIPIMTEYIGSEAFGMYIDACWVQTFANPHAHAFNNYDLDFARFTYPRIKYFEWGQNEKTFEVDARRAFFNGIGGARGDLTAAQSQQHADMTNAQKDMYEALTCDDPEPFVQSATEKLFVNFFPGKNQTVWTYYNKGAKNAAGKIPVADKFSGKRFIEVLTDREVQFDNGMLLLAMDEFEVGMIAAFDRIIRTEAVNGKIEVSLDQEKVSADSILILAPRNLDRKNHWRKISGEALFSPVTVDPEEVGIIKFYQGKMLMDEVIIAE